MFSNIDFLIIGAGLYGSTIARLLRDAGFVCIIYDKRANIAGNAYTELVNGGYYKHVYGSHIFHTDNIEVENFVKKYSEWIPYVHNTIAIDSDNLYHLPFNMNTYYDIFKVTNPQEAKYIIDKEIKEAGIENPTNLEEQAISMVGKTIFEKLIKNYTEKQWGCSCKELSPDIIKRLPLRYSFNNNYFNDCFQAIPKYGYTEFVKNIIEDIPCICNIEFKAEDYDYWKDKVKYNIIYCGAVDELLNYNYGTLGWRSLRFEDTKYIYNGYNGQGTAIINDVGNINKHTRTIEHMWFTPDKVFNGIESIITNEYPENWNLRKEKFYSINNTKFNSKYYEMVNALNNNMPKIKLGGRLGKYKYFDMDDTIMEAIKDANQLKKYKKI